MNYCTEANKLTEFSDLLFDLSQCPEKMGLQEHYKTLVEMAIILRSELAIIAWEVEDQYRKLEAFTEAMPDVKLRLCDTGDYVIDGEWLDKQQFTNNQKILDEIRALVI